MKHSMITALAALAVTVGCEGGSSLGGLDVEQTFDFVLTSAEEVPAPKATTASGDALILVFPARIDFQLRATAMTGITMAHIHSGAPGVAGPVVVTLFLPGAPTAIVNGTFAGGSLTAANLPAGVTLQSLKTLLLSGNSYVNVHTTANPAGEIRGQIK